MHCRITWPEGDIIVHAGDFTMVERPVKIKNLGIGYVTLISMQLF